MIVEKETELNHPIIILENQKELDTLLNICKSILTLHVSVKARNMSQEIIDKLS